MPPTGSRPARSSPSRPTARRIGSGQADPAGHFDNSADPSTPFQPQPLQGKNVGTLQLTAEDGAGGIAGPVPVKAANLTITGPRAPSKPHKKVNFRVFGFQTNKKVYLHIRRKGKTKRRFSLGTARGDCGLRTKKMRFMPLDNYKTGTYELLLLAQQEVLQEDRHRRKVTIYRPSAPRLDSDDRAGAWD